jgi:hypothetical protein
MSHEVSPSSGSQVEAFVRLSQAPTLDAERAIRAIERVGGRVAHAFVPAALIVELPADRLDIHIGDADLEAIDTGIIDEAQLPAGRPQLRVAVSVWNQRLRAAATTQGARESTQGLPWDTPGRLPPDPPESVRQELHRREEDSQKGSGGGGGA